MATSTERPRAAIYVRVSTRGQEEDGTSLESQEAACRKYAADRGYDLDGQHFHREVYTGAELYDRPKLSLLRQAVREGALAAVIAYATDRLSRDPIHLALLAEECQRAGVSLEFVTEPLDNSPEGALLRYVKGYAHSKEREAIRERSLRGKFTRAQRGELHNYGAELYGYRRDKEARVRAVHEPEAAIIRRIFRWIAEERVPLREVARRLNEQGVPPPSAGKISYSDPGRTPRWGKTMVQRILDNPAYKGQPVAWRRHRTSKTVLVMRPESEWIQLPEATTPAIVPPALFDAALARLDANKGEDTRNQARPYLLRGFVYCAVCGQRMRSEPEHNRRVYRCASRDTAAGACGGRRVPADEVEAWAWEQLAAVLRDPTIVAAELQRQRDAGPDAALVADLEAARRALAKITKQQERLVHRLRDADDDLAGLIEQDVAKLTQEKRAMEAVITDIERRMAQDQATAEQLAALTDYCARVAGNLGRFGFEEKRMALEALGARVEATSSSKTAEWKLSGSIPLVGVGVTARSY